MTITNDYVYDTILYAQVVSGRLGNKLAKAYKVGEKCEDKELTLLTLDMAIEALRGFNTGEDSCLTIAQAKNIILLIAKITGPTPVVTRDLTTNNSADEVYIYWGTRTTFTSPSDANILALTGAGVGSGRVLATAINNNYDGIDGGGNYLIFAWPTSFGEPKFMINSLEANVFTKIRDNSLFTNQDGNTINYDVWISDTKQHSPIDNLTIEPA